MKRPLPNTYWAVDGQFLAGEYPGGSNPDDARRRIGKLLEAGINSFIDLTEAHELPEYRTLLPREVAYYRRPLPDHDIPGDPAAMHEIQSVLRSTLADGARIYLHCRAGIGRTGMSVGCWLVEGGLGGEHALTRLNELWQQNARSRQWLRTPETEAQEQYVLRWNAHRAPAAGTETARLATLAGAAAPLATTKLIDRARGMLLGLALGDAQSVLASEGLPPGTWTDDTAMALCQADSLIARGGVDTRDQAERYLRWLREGYRSATGVPLGVRPEARKALGLAAARRSALSGTHDPRVLDPAPLVRCAPAVLFHSSNLDQAVEAAADAARVTHQAPVLVDACRVFAALLFTALQGKPRAEVLSSWREWAGTLRPEVREVAEAWGDLAADQPRLRRRTVLYTLDSAVRAYAGAVDFMAGLDPLLLPDEDADLRCAAFGQLAGATFGEHWLPEAACAELVDGAGIAELAEALVESGNRVRAGALPAGG